MFVSCVKRKQPRGTGLPSDTVSLWSSDCVTKWGVTVKPPNFVGSQANMVTHIKLLKYICDTRSTRRTNKSETSDG